MNIGDVTIGECPVICASIKGKDPDEILRKVDMANLSDIIEIRLDGFPISVSESKRMLRSIKQRTDKPILITNRMEAEGGTFAGSEQERINIIKEVSLFADAIDIELRTEERQRKEIIEICKERRKTAIISYHDMLTSHSVEEISLIFHRMAETGANIAKVAVLANTLEDVLNLLMATLQTKSTLSIPLVSIPLGEKWKFARLCSVLFGSSILYCSVDELSKTAPGQLTVEDAFEILKRLGLR
ncbi:MAG: type I 3-dehydroquinate dehydratase [Candidatus Hydrothermarchaeota archaeon]